MTRLHSAIPIQSTLHRLIIIAIIIAFAFVLWHNTAWHDMHFVWFSMWDGFFSPRVSESRPSRVAMRVGFWDEWWEIHLTWKTIQNAFSRILYTLRHFKVIPLVYAIYFPTIDFFLYQLVIMWTVSLQKNRWIFLNGHWSTYPPMTVLFIYFLKAFYFCVTTSTKIIWHSTYTSLGRYLSWTITISLYIIILKYTTNI